MVSSSSWCGRRASGPTNWPSLSKTRSWGMPLTRRSARSSRAPTGLFHFSSTRSDGAAMPRFDRFQSPVRNRQAQPQHQSGRRTPGSVGRHWPTPTGSSRERRGHLSRGAWDASPPRSWNSSRPRAAANSPATTPSPCDRAAHGRVTVVRWRPSLRPKVWSAGLHSWQRPAAGRAKLKIARGHSVSIRLTIQYSHQRGGATAADQTYRPGGRLRHPGRQDPAGPDRHPTEAATMVVELSGDSNIFRSWPPPRVARGSGVCSWTGPRAKSASTPTAAVDCGICTQRLPQRRLEQSAFLPGSSTSMPSAVWSVSSASQLHRCDVPIAHGVGVAMTRPFHPLPTLVKIEAAPVARPPQVVQSRCPGRAPA